jgi:hypothetical protein
MQFILAVGFVVGTIIVSGKLGLKDLQKIKTKTLSLIESMEMQGFLFQ